MSSKDEKQHATATDDQSVSDEVSDEHVGLRRVPGPIPWFLFIICVVEVSASDPPRSTATRRTTTTVYTDHCETSSARDSSISASPDPFRTTSNVLTSPDQGYLEHLEGANPSALL